MSNTARPSVVTSQRQHGAARLPWKGEFSMNVIVTDGTVSVTVKGLAADVALALSEVRTGLSGLEMAERLGPGALISLRQKVHMLRQKGIGIETDWEEVRDRHGEKCRVARWRLPEQVTVTSIFSNDD